MNQSSRPPSLLALGFACGMVSMVLAVPPAARILDADIELPERPPPVISPDGQRIIYISQGAVWYGPVHEAAPRRIAELPTWEHLLRLPEHALGGRSFQAVARGLTGRQYREQLAQGSVEVSTLVWTRDSDGVILRASIRDPIMEKSVGVTYLLSKDGKVTLITKQDPSVPTKLPRSRQPSPWIWLSPRQDYAVFGSPLILDKSSNTPRSTCFDTLGLSSTSNRCLAMEKDTRQLLILDENLDVTQRIEHTVPLAAGQPELHWSPDEQFVVLTRRGPNHRGNRWQGYRLDLKTSEVQEFSDLHFGHWIAFTGNGGEFVCMNHVPAQRSAASISHGDLLYEDGGHVQSHQLTIVSDGSAEPHVVWQTNDIRVHVGPSVFSAPGCRLFAIAVPRPEPAPVGFAWHLFDRDGNQWRFPGDDTGEFLSPYQIVGFASEGTLVIAHDTKNLFAIPVSVIQEPANQVK